MTLAMCYLTWKLVTGVAKSCQACFVGPVSPNESKFWNGFPSPISGHVWNYKLVHSNEVVGIVGQLRMDICAETNMLCPKNSSLQEMDTSD